MKTWNIRKICWLSVALTQAYFGILTAESVIARKQTQLPVFESQRISEAEMKRMVRSKVEIPFPPEDLVIKPIGSRRLAVEVTISESGDVVSARNITGLSSLKEAALKAAKQWPSRV